MTNKERQKSLEKKKWLASERKCEDLSGKMPYCKRCYYHGLNYGDVVCLASQDKRETDCLCATAYNRMQRKGR